MANYTPEQLATRYKNASDKLGAVTDTLEALCDREHGEAIAGMAGTALHYINRLCEQLDLKSVPASPWPSRLQRIRDKHTRSGGPDEQELADMGRTS